MVIPNTSALGDDGLIEAIRARARNPATQTDREGATKLSPAASEVECGTAERVLGTTLHPFHRRLLAEVANGGFGPSFGLFGLPPDSGEPSMLELREALRATEEHPAWPGVVALPDDVWRGLLPIIDWGCGQWSLIDSSSPEGDILLLDEEGLFKTEHDIRTLFEAWVRGVDLADGLLPDGDRQGTERRERWKVRTL